MIQYVTEITKSTETTLGGGPDCMGTLLMSKNDMLGTGQHHNDTQIVYHVYGVATIDETGDRHSMQSSGAEVLYEWEIQKQALSGDAQ